MKTTDDYQAKIRHWALHPEVPRLPRPIAWPPFQSKKFNSYQEMNDWKRKYLLEIAGQGGLKWTKDIVFLERKKEVQRH
jgi:hypothetical protein